MKKWLASGLTLFLCGCLLEHLRKDIPPPGGCDQCHRYRISSDWEMAVAPVELGREDRLPEDDIVLKDLQRLPYHRHVPSKRLSVFAAAASPEAIGDEETGIQCFVCHRSPGPPHDELRGTFPHPWGGNRSQDE